MIVFGRAIEPIFETTCSRSSLDRASLESFPPRSVTNAKIACVVTGSSRPMTAASATFGCETSADSTSVVEMRWPGDLHHVVDAAHEPEVALAVALRAVAGEVAPGSGSSTFAVALVVLVDPRSIAGHGRVITR